MVQAKNQPQDDEVIAYEPDRTIRELIGTDIELTQIFTPEKIAACQKTIDSARDTFFDVAGMDLAKLEAFVQNPAAAANTAAFDDIAALAGNIKGHAELFGYSLVAAIGTHIVDHCEPGARTPEVRLRLIADLVKMLHIAIKQKISDARGALGRELGASLRKY